MSLRATDRSDRRRRRQTEFHIEFSLSALNLSSDIAATAVTELSKHQETIQATAAMSFEDALVVHDDCIRSNTSKLKQLHQKLLDSGQAPTKDHQALVQLHSNAIDSHTKLLNVRKALQANGTKHTKNHVLAVINQHSDHIHKIKKKVSQQHNLPNVGFSVAKVISIVHKHPAHTLPASIKQEQQGSSHNLTDDAQLSASSDDEEDSSSGGGRQEETDEGANWFEKIEFAHTAAEAAARVGDSSVDGSFTSGQLRGMKREIDNAAGASVGPGHPVVESGHQQLVTAGTPTTTTTSNTTTITTIALEKLKAENEQRRKTTEIQTATIAQLQRELTELRVQLKSNATEIQTATIAQLRRELTDLRVQLKSNAQTAASAAYRTKELVESNQQLLAEKNATKIIALDKAKLEWQTARTADSQSTQTATDAALKELEQKYSRQAIKMQQLEMHLRQKSVDIENTQREHEREQEQKLNNAVRKMEEMSESMAESMAATNERTEHNLCTFQSYLTAMRKEAANSASREGGAPETLAIHSMRPSPPSPAAGEAESLFVARNGRMTLRLGKLPAHPSTSLNKRRKKKTSSKGRLYHD